MASLNKVILVGNLGRDPELKSTPSGAKVLDISIATTERIRDKDNREQWVDQTEWHRLVMWNQTAEYIARNTRKGSTVYVEGKLRYRKFTGQDGIEKNTTDILVDNISVLGGRADSGNNNFVGEQPQYQKSYGGNNNNNTAKPEAENFGEAPAVTDDLPF